MTFSSELDVDANNSAYFAFARIKGDVHLVQASNSTPISPLAAVDVKVFRHEFISIFRFSEYRTLHPSDICILEPIDEQLTKYEEDSETVFLARNVMERLRKLTSPRWHFGVNAPRSHARANAQCSPSQHNRGTSPTTLAAGQRLRQR